MTHTRRGSESPRGRQAARKLVIALCSTLLMLGLFEVGFRLVQPGPPEKLTPQIKHVYVPRDPAQGRVSDYWHLAPNETGYQLNVPVTTNSLGLRNVEVEPAKPKDRYRILALGDSHTFGFGVVEAETWPRLLEAKLKRHWSAEPLEVVNGGIEALSIEQEIQLFKDRLLPLAPDVVILAYYWNDMPIQGEPLAEWPAVKEMIPPSMLPHTLPPSEETEPSRASLSAGESVFTWVKSALRKSYLLYAVVQRLPILQMTFSDSDATGWKRAVLDGARSTRIDASWRFVEQQLMELKQMEREHHFRLFVVIIPLFEQMTSPGFERAAYQTTLSEIGRRLGIPMIDPLPAIREIRPSYPGFFIPFDGHPNGRIYKVIAEEVSKGLIAGRRR